MQIGGCSGESGHSDVECLGGTVISYNGHQMNNELFVQNLVNALTRVLPQILHRQRGDQ